MQRVEITQKSLDIAHALSQLQLLDVGAVASFTGIARRDDGVVAIELEHYPGMTDRMLEQLVDIAVSHFQLLGCIVMHRVGRIDVGAPIVFVGTAALHRTAALEACSFLIDRLKVEAAFWKKEYLSNGSSRWVEARDSDDQRAAIWQA